jgi:hypothetical protein
LSCIHPDFWVERAEVDRLTLEYGVSGTGESMLFIRGAWVADSFPPLLGQEDGSSRHRMPPDPVSAGIDPSTRYVRHKSHEHVKQPDSRGVFSRGHDG